MHVEFTLWQRDVEDERPDPDTYVEELYDAACAELPHVIGQLEDGPLGARISRASDDLTDDGYFIEHRAWRVAGKVLLAGVKHGDTDTPVRIVVVLREEKRRAQRTDEADDDWL